MTNRSFKDLAAEIREVAEAKIGPVRSVLATEFSGPRSWSVTIRCLNGTVIAVTGSSRAVASVNALVFLRRLESAK